jgi:hemoglobin-like flavoprotein
MTPEKIKLVQGSWAFVKPISDQAASLFYNKLFELDPSLKPLFKSPQEEQGRKLMAMINTAVLGLSDLASIVAAIQDMGRRHIAYGVQDEHYDTVGEALIWTLSAGLGDKFTADVKEAWIETYLLVATTMKDAAKGMS